MFQIVIQYNVASSSTKYVICKELIQIIKKDATPQISLDKSHGKSVHQIASLYHWL